MSNNIIHQTAIVSKKAKIGNNVKIGPFCLIGDNVKIGNNVELKSHVVLEGHTTLGDNNIIYPFASIGHAPQDLKFEGENSEVIIGNNNVIREYTTIQPGTKGDKMKTVVGDNNLIMIGTHIAHDCVIGNNNVFANHTTFAGHVQVGNFVRIGGLVAVHQYVRIGSYAIIGGFCAIVRDVIPFAMIIGERSALEGINIVGMRRNGFDNDEILSAKEAVNKIFWSEEGILEDRIQKVKSDYQHNQVIDNIVDFMEEGSVRSFTTPKSKSQS